MESAYVQYASRVSDPNAKHFVSFTNLSNQQQFPGDLHKFHGAQVASVQPMPFSNDDIQAPAQASFSSAMSEGHNNVSQLPRINTRDIYFRDNVKSTRVEFRTPSMRAWNVPFSQIEARAGDLM